MENISAYVTGGLIVFTPLVINLLFAKYIETFAQQYFKSKKKAGTVINGIIGFCIIIGIAIFFAPYLSDQKPNIAETALRIDTIAPKSDLEVKIETGREIIEGGIEAGKTLKENLDRKDSIRRVNRDSLFAYMIGTPFSDVDDAISLYQQLKDNAQANGLSLFRKSRKKIYAVIKSGTFSNRKEAEDSLSVFKRQIASIIQTKITIIDLMDECAERSKRKKPVNTEVSRKSIPCVICAKD
jgi:hypothetical protein